MSSSISTLAIDATHAGMAENPTGVEVYSSVLLPRLSELLMAQNIDVTWIGHTAQPSPITPKGVHWISSPHRRFWSQTTLPSLLSHIRPNLFFTPSGIPPLRSVVPTAATVHDLAVYLVPHAYSPADRFRLDWLSRHACRQASRIITPSQYVSQQVQQFWHIQPHKIAVVPHGYEPESVAPLPVELPVRRFFLYVGRVETKKNLGVVIDGFAKLAAEDEVIGLVLAGRPGLGSAAIMRHIAKLPTSIRSRIFLPGYVSENQKIWLYQQAIAVLVPCPVEGFGFPVLEAFAVDKPAICAQSGALTEVAGDAALYVQPDIATDWYLHMRKAIQEPELVHELVRKGRQYLAAYTWESAAKQTAQALTTLS